MSALFQFSVLSSQFLMMNVMVVAKRQFTDSAAGYCLGRGSIHFFVEGESECTSERALGQFSIFGAVEEMFATDFQGSERIKNPFRDMAVSRLES